MIEIKHKETGKVLHYVEAKTLVNANLSQLDLSGADLNCADLIGANLTLTNLSQSEMGGANLIAARLFQTNLAGANLTASYLLNTHITRTNFTGANINMAYLSETEFVDCPTLHEARGLDRIRCTGPSSMDRRTVKANIERLPDSFLIAIGYNEEEIDVLRGLYASPFRYYTCFISYSTHDEIFASRIHSDLLSIGISSWYAPHDVVGGRSIHEQLDEAITFSDKIVLILSSASITSDWVRWEVKKAKDKERTTNRRVLFPISLDNSFHTASDEWAFIKSDHHVLDFADWQEARSYKNAFASLARELTLSAANEMPEED